MAALEGFGLEAVMVATPEELVADMVTSSVVVAPMLGPGDDCGLVRPVARRFPLAMIVALVPRITIRSVRQAIHCGASTLVDLTQPATEAAETVYQASIGFSRFPTWLVRVAPPLGTFLLEPEEVPWLRLLEDESLTMVEVAQRAGWSRAELYRRLGPIYARLGVVTRREAVLRARELGLLT